MREPALPVGTLKPFRIGGNGVRQELERNIASELRVPRPIHLAHAAHTDKQDGDFIRTEARAGRQRQTVVDYTGRTAVLGDYS